jgi:hypothetical protein
MAKQLRLVARTGNTSDTPLSSGTPSAQPQHGALFNRSTGAGNGAPSSAAQMQGRR